MRIFFIGDVVGQKGCDFVRDKLPGARRFWQPDMVVVNGENSAQGNGVLPDSALSLFDSGADVLTLGNHALQRREVYDYLDREEAIIRPANFHSTAPGRGWTIFDRPGSPPVAVVNLLGRVGVEGAYTSPFDAADAILSQLSTKIILVDFHAEATSEKFALGWYLDGRVSAVVGTHTHVQTADERILPRGTGYITDVGMCGSFHSSLGIRPDQAVARFRTGLPSRFEYDSGPFRLCGVVVDIDPATGLATAIQRVNIE